jgi:penicillin-binding protein 1A
VVDKESGESYINSWFAETVIEDASLALADKLDVSQNLARKLLKSGGYKIYTTVSPTIQKELEEYFKNTDNFPKAVESGLEFSMIISEHKNGNLLATVGGVGEKSGNRILNYAETNITPGSTLKPIALYAPLLDEKKISWSSVFDDVPVKFKRNGSTLPLAFPRNSPDVYDGLTTVKDALSLSKNTVAVRLFSMLGAENIYENLYENFGFSSLVKGKRLDNGTVVSDLSESPLALGQLTYGVTLRKLTESYNVFPNDGMLSKGRSFIAIFDSFDNLILENKTEPKQVFSAECARIMNKLLEAVVDEGTAKRISLNEIVDTAGKTGTSGGGHDKLFVGYTPYFTAGIWCGYKGDKRAVHFESKTHLDIWNDIARRVYNSFNIREEERHFSVDGLVYLPYCKDSGEMFSENCMLDPRSDRMDFGYFTSDNAPNSKCQRHVVVRYDKSSGGIATDLCPENEIVDIALLKIEGRSFPYEIFVKDAEYTVRAFSGNEDLAKEYLLPHFDKNLPKLEYSGKSRKKKQFNSSCDIHEE